MEHELPLRGVLEPCAREFEGGQFAGVEQVYDAPAVHAVSRKAVGMPCEDSRRFPGLDPSEHVIKYGSPRRLGGLLFDEFGHNGQFLVCREFAEFGKLGVNRENLLVLDIGGFAGVEKI
ncbi:MAG TPA: hypothetical protein VN048_17425 [Verrucomicrobiae bacterium]|nr:hypothetical protein [Verrucomicrobiae bacterium]